VVGIAGIAVFGIAATPGICGIYYKTSELVINNGTSYLEKEYGPLHIIYYFYLLLYFIIIVCTVIRFYFKKKDASVTQVVMLSLSAFINIIVWLIEQFMDNEFEILSVSYVICELFLIGLYAIANENARLKELGNTEKKKTASIEIDSETVDLFNRGIEKLTNTERTIFDLYVSGGSSKDVMATLFITENTLKFHNKNIYGKLCVPSRKKLIEIYQYINKK
jgi:DNA-binding CsgD family transcriptional regulator